eukprot:Awhi_evm1s9029
MEVQKPQYNKPRPPHLGGLHHTYSLPNDQITSSSDEPLHQKSLPPANSSLTRIPTTPTTTPSSPTALTSPNTSLNSSPSLNGQSRQQRKRAISISLLKTAVRASTIDIIGSNTIKEEVNPTSGEVSLHRENIDQINLLDILSSPTSKASQEFVRFLQAERSDENFWFWVIVEELFVKFQKLLDGNAKEDELREDIDSLEKDFVLDISDDSETEDTDEDHSHGMRNSNGIHLSQKNIIDGIDSGSHASLAVICSYNRSRSNSCSNDDTKNKDKTNSQDYKKKNRSRSASQNSELSRTSSKNENRSRSNSHDGNKGYNDDIDCNRSPNIHNPTVTRTRSRSYSHHRQSNSMAGKKSKSSNTSTNSSKSSSRNRSRSNSIREDDYDAGMQNSITSTTDLKADKTLNNAKQLRKDIMKECEMIINSFVIQGSSKEVNLTNSSRESLIQSYTQSKDLDVDTVDFDKIHVAFVKVQTEIYKLLLKDTLPRFKKYVEEKVEDSHDDNGDNSSSLSKRNSLSFRNLRRKATLTNASGGSINNSGTSTPFRKRMSFIHNNFSSSDTDKTSAIVPNSSNAPLNREYFNGTFIEKKKAGSLIDVTLKAKDLVPLSATVEASATMNDELETNPGSSDNNISDKMDLSSVPTHGSSTLGGENVVISSRLRSKLSRWKNNVQTRMREDSPNTTSSYVRPAKAYEDDDDDFDVNLHQKELQAKLELLFLEGFMPSSDSDEEDVPVTMTAIPSNSNHDNFAEPKFKKPLAPTASISNPQGVNVRATPSFKNVMSNSDDGAVADDLLDYLKKFATSSNPPSSSSSDTSIPPNPIKMSSMGAKNDLTPFNSLEIPDNQQPRRRSSHFIARDGEDHLSMRNNIFKSREVLNSFSKAEESSSTCPSFANVPPAKPIFRHSTVRERSGTYTGYTKSERRALYGQNRCNSNLGSDNGKRSIELLSQTNDQLDRLLIKMEAKIRPENSEERIRENSLKMNSENISPKTTTNQLTKRAQSQISRREVLSSVDLIVQELSSSIDNLYPDLQSTPTIQTNPLFENDDDWSDIDDAGSRQRRNTKSSYVTPRGSFKHLGHLRHLGHFGSRRASLASMTKSIEEEEEDTDENRRQSNDILVKRPRSKSLCFFYSNDDSLACECGDSLLALKRYKKNNPHHIESSMSEKKLSSQSNNNLDVHPAGFFFDSSSFNDCIPRLRSNSGSKGKSFVYVKSKNCHCSSRSSSGLPFSNSPSQPSTPKLDPTSSTSLIAVSTTVKV